jgi:hypothetical protein
MDLEEESEDSLVSAHWDVQYQNADHRPSNPHASPLTELEDKQQAAPFDRTTAPFSFPNAVQHAVELRHAGCKARCKAAPRLSTHASTSMVVFES